MTPVVLSYVASVTVKLLPPVTATLLDVELTNVWAPVPTACVTIPHNVVIVDATSIQHASEYVVLPESLLIVLSVV